MKDKLQETVQNYRDNPDLKSLIDKVQRDVCGVFLYFSLCLDLVHNLNHGYFFNDSKEIDHRMKVTSHLDWQHSK